jgi:hypothetical protein
VYARSITIQLHTSAVDDGIALIRDELIPALQGMAGYGGMSMLVNRQSGRCFVTTAWETREEAIRAGANAPPMPGRVAAMLSATPSFDDWEIAVLHRDRRSPEGAGVRATWVQVPAGAMDQAVEYYKASVLPQLADVDGFCSSSLLVNRASGRAVSSATFDSVDAMQRNRDQVTALKYTSMREAGVDERDECEFELALAYGEVGLA